MEQGAPTLEVAKPARKFTAVSPITVSLAVALAIRVIIALSFQNIIAPDEIFQFLEQAHRLVFGQGVVPWEFQVGLRSWLIPLILAAPMAGAHLLFPNPLIGLLLIRILLCLASLPIVWCAAKWGGQFYGRNGAFIAGLFTAFWPDLWLMAPHPLEEVLAADLLVPAIYLVGTCKSSASLSRIAWTGFLLGLAFTLRVQLAPAVAAAGIALCGSHFRRWRVAILAGALPVLSAGMLDWYTWGEPFRSFWLNIYLNVFLGVAKDEFGASPPAYFIGMLTLDWLWTFPVIGLLALRGARHLPLPGICAVLVIIVHSLIAHKEYRFIFPAIALIVPLAGLGLAGVLAQLAATKTLSGKRMLLGAMLLTGPLISPWVYFMLLWQTNSFAIFENLAARHRCIVSLPLWDKKLFLPFDLDFTSPSVLTGETIYFNGTINVEADTIVSGKDKLATIPTNFKLDSCHKGNWIPFAPKPQPEICVWTRSVSSCPASSVPPFVFPFPKAAQPFVIRASAK